MLVERPELTVDSVPVEEMPHVLLDAQTTAPAAGGSSLTLGHVLSGLEKAVACRSGYRTSTSSSARSARAIPRTYRGRKTWLRSECSPHERAGAPASEAPRDIPADRAAHAHS
jgi:hypothetical protein